MANEGTHKVKVCRTCHTLLTQNSTKPFTEVLQTEIWQTPIDNAISAAFSPLRRISYMTRFSGEITGNPESLAEHSFSVLVTSVQINQHYQLGVDKGELVTTAAFHDIGEISSGDIPSPLKTKKLKKESDLLEDKAIDKMVNEWNVDLGGLKNYDYSDVNNTVSRIVKCADYISVVVYCVEEIYIGSKNLQTALNRALDKFSQFVYNDWEKDLYNRTLEHVKKYDPSRS